VPRGIPRLGHVAPFTFSHNNDTCQNTICPCLPTPAQSTCQLFYHVTVRPYGLYGHLPRQHCTDCTISKILSVWKNEQNAIYFSYNIYLIMFKLRWVHDDEAYTHVCFDAIPSNLIFEQNLIPCLSDKTIYQGSWLLKFYFILIDRCF